MNKALPLLALALAAGTCAAQTNGPQDKSVQIDGYAARVNDRVITAGEVREMIAPQLPELYRKYSGAELEAEIKKAFEKARDDLVERALIMEAFKKRGGQIPDQYVDDEINRIVNDRFKGDRALFEQVLREQHKSLQEYKDMLRDQIGAGMMYNEEVARRARVTPEQVRAAYEQNKERYLIPMQVQYSVILLNKGTTPEDQAVKRKEIESIRQRLVDGADFAQTAKESSEGSHADQGGAYPWLQPKDAPSELRQALATLPVGAISQPIETADSLYLVKVDARRDASYKPFDEVRNDLTTELVNQERARLRQRWIERLKSENYVKIYNN